MCGPRPVGYKGGPRAVGYKGEAHSSGLYSPTEQVVEALQGFLMASFTSAFKAIGVRKHIREWYEYISTPNDVKFDRSIPTTQIIILGSHHRLG